MPALRGREEGQGGVSALTYPQVDIPAAATTIARRLDRAGLADSGNDATAAWLHDLSLYQEIIDKERRMALFLAAGRRVDGDGLVTVDEDAVAEAAWRSFLGDLAAWQAHACEAREMIATLDHELTAMEKIGIERWVPWQRAVGAYLKARYHATSVRPLPPGWGAWRWDHSLATWRTLAYRDHLLPVRRSYLLLTPASKRAARDEFGIAEIADILATVFPVDELHALDRRAALLHVDTRVRLDLEDKWHQASLARRAGRR